MSEWAVPAELKEGMSLWRVSCFDPATNGGVRVPVFLSMHPVREGLNQSPLFSVCCPYPFSLRPTWCTCLCVDSSSSSRLNTFLMLPMDPRSSCPLTPRGCSPQASLQSQAQGQVCWRWELWAARRTCQSKMRRTIMTWSTEVTHACTEEKTKVVCSCFGKKLNVNADLVFFFIFFF